MVQEYRPQDYWACVECEQLKLNSDLWVEKSGCFCLHHPRCWMVRRQQLAFCVPVLIKKKASSKMFSKFRIFCAVFTLLWREQTLLWMISGILPPIIFENIFSFLSACGFWTIYFEPSVTWCCQHSPPPCMPSVCAWRVLTPSWSACRQLLQSGVKLFITKRICQHVLWN